MSTRTEEHITGLFVAPTLTPPGPGSWDCPCPFIVENNLSDAAEYCFTIHAGPPRGRWPTDERVFTVNLSTIRLLWVG
jgi:hypothetical protein